MHLERYVRIVLKRWWLILLVVVVSTATATYNTLRQTPIYRSTVILLLSPATNTSEIYYTDSAASASADLAETYIYYLRTKTFADSVIESEQLNLSAGALIGSVKARMIEGTQFFEITATASSPEEAQFLAASIANNFIRQNIAQQRTEVIARRDAGDVDNVNALLAEKLERERGYFEEQVTALREEVERLSGQPPSIARDELLAAAQLRTSEYEDKLMHIMGEQVDLRPPIDESQFTTVTIAEAADLPVQPINTTGNRSILYAIVASLVLGVGLAFGLEYLDYTIHGADDLEDLMGQSPLGVLAIIAADPTQRVNGAGVAEDVVCLTQPRSPTAEAFRSLLTNLRFSGAGHQIRSLVITSAGPGEGKSVIAANLAVAFAQSGRRVILVDADMRRPTVQERFHLPKQLGLSRLMIDENATSPDVIEKYLQQGPVASLRILTSGPIPPNPAELLGAPWASAIFDAIEERAEIIIWDSPPALTVTDAVILAARTDATLQVIKAGVTRRDLILKTREVLQRVGANVLAPVLNQVKGRDVGYYQYYYSKHGDGHSRDADQESVEVDSAALADGVSTSQGTINGNGTSAKPSDSNRARGKSRRRNALLR